MNPILDICLRRAKGGSVPQTYLTEYTLLQWMLKDKLMINNDKTVIIITESQD